MPLNQLLRKLVKNQIYIHPIANIVYTLNQVIKLNQLFPIKSLAKPEKEKAAEHLYYHYSNLP